jgi:RNA polymerase sigma-70 factor (ECF subfamily)
MDIALDQAKDETNIIEACVRKEKWAQRIVYETYYAEMLSVCMRYSKDESQAEDILHEAFIKVFRYIHRYKPNTALNAWIKRIVVNSSIDQYRKNVRRRHVDLDNTYNLESGDVDPHSTCTEKDILKCIQSLSDRYRAVFNLYVIDGFSHREVAKKLN